MLIIIKMLCLSAHLLREGVFDCKFNALIYGVRSPKCKVYLDVSVCVSFTIQGGYLFLLNML